MPPWLRRAVVLLLSTLLCFWFNAAAQATDANPKTQPPVRPNPKGAQKAIQIGKNAEAQGRLEAALAAYDTAVRLDPRNANALALAAVVRSQLVHARVDKAEKLALSGEVEQAVRSLRDALHIDPGNPLVAERLRQVQDMPQSTAPKAAMEPGLAAIPRLQPQSGRRSFNLTGDVQTVYQQAANSFGVKAIFDAELTSRPVRLRVDDVDFTTAVEILQIETATFIRPIDSNTFFVAADTQAKRREYGLTVEQSFALPESVTLEEMSEVLRILRDMTGSSHIQFDAKNRSITLRDSPETAALVGSLLKQLERARGELLLEIELLEVDRNKAMQLGITPPTSARLFSINPNAIKSLEQAKDVQTLISLLQQIFGGQAALGGSALIPPFIAVGGGKTTMLLTLPSAAASFSDALSLVRSGRRVLMRAQDGRPATFFVGDRFPVTLSLLSSSLGTPTFTQAVSAGLFPRSDFAVGNTPTALVTEDFDGDGLRDIAVVNQADNKVTILLNKGGASFAEAAGSPITIGTPPAGTRPFAISSAIAAAKFNSKNNSFVDLLATDPVANTVTLLLGNGDGTFTAAAGSPITVGNAPSAIVTGDFDGDGQQDFAVTNFGDNTLSVFFGDGNGGFIAAPGSPYPLPSNAQGPVAMVANDFDGNGKLDLAIVTNNKDTTTQGNVLIVLGNADGTFTPTTGTLVAVGKGPAAIASGDLTRDSRPDLAIVNQTDATLTVLFNNGDATFAAASQSPLATGTKPAGVIIAGFNPTGSGDIAVTNQGVDSVGVYLGLGNGLFAPRFEMPAVTGGEPTALVASDMNADGALDVVFTEQKSNQVSIVFNPISFAPGFIPGLSQQPYPASEYVDLGVKIKATPTLHPQREVTLQLEFEIRALSGQSVNGIPILSNRTLTQSVRVKEGETTLIGGLFDKEETRSLSALPALAQVPAASYFFSRRNTQSTDTELLILVTPRRLRRPDRASKSIYAGRGAISPTSRTTPPVVAPQQ